MHLQQIVAYRLVRYVINACDILKESEVRELVFGVEVQPNRSDARTIRSSQ